MVANTQPDTPSNSLPRFLNERQMTSLIGVHRATLRRWEAAGIFPKRKKLGPGRIGWSEDAYKKWAQTRV